MKNIKLTKTKKVRSYLLFQIDHHPEVCPEGIAAAVELGKNCCDLKILDVDGNSKKQLPYIAETI